MPRLKRGEVAPGVLKRVEATSNQVDLRIRHLREDSNHPRRTISSVAAWEDLEKGIVPISTNSLKKYAASKLDGGLAELDQLVSGESNQGDAMDTAPMGEDARTAALADAIYSFSLRYGDLMDRFRRLAVHDSSVKRELDSHRKLYGWSNE